MNFSGFLGNIQVKNSLELLFSSGRFPHAVVFEGASGCGKRTFAKLIAQALVCRNPAEAPCGVCESCIRAKAGSHPDIRIEQGSGATRSLSVDTIKSIGVDTYRMAQEANVSCYLLFIENKISEAAQNKLLKMIEEPAANTVFIITVSSAQLLLETIRSRVQVFTLFPPSESDAAQYVADKLDIGLERAEKLAQLYGANIGQMLSQAETNESESALVIAQHVAESMLSTNEYKLIEISAAFIKNKELFREVLSRLILIFRDACVLRVGGKQMLSGAQAEVLILQRLTLSRLSKLTGIAEEFKRKIDTNANMTLLVTDFCARLKSAVSD